MNKLINSSTASASDKVLLWFIENGNPMQMVT